MAAESREMPLKFRGKSRLSICQSLGCMSKIKVLAVTYRSALYVYLDCGGNYDCIYLSKHVEVHLKRVNFTICKLSP